MSEYGAIMGVLGALCVLGAASGIWPAVDRLASLAFAVLFALAALAVAGYVARELWRELAFRAEMRALDRHDQRSARRAPAGVRS